MVILTLDFFFHFFATTRKKMNTISTITSGNGNLFNNHKQISNVAKHYFENIYCNDVVDFTSVINLTMFFKHARHN